MLKVRIIPTLLCKGAGLVKGSGFDSGRRVGAVLPAIKVYNNRGATSRSLDEGGRQEWDLSERYRAREGQFLERWPRTAAIMRRLADTYESHARREDTEAERRRRGLEH